MNPIDRKFLEPVPTNTSESWEERFDEKLSPEWWKGFGSTDDIDKKGIAGIKDFIKSVESAAYLKGQKKVINDLWNTLSPVIVNQVGPFDGDYLLKMEDIKKYAQDKGIFDVSIN